MALNRYSCPCCGHLTYDRPAAGTMQLCPVCFWEDSPGEAPWNNSNAVSLLTAQENFAEFGAAEEEFVDCVRPALRGEERPPGWLSLKELCQEVMVMIESAFADTELEDGITIHQREAIDDYLSKEDFENARSFDNEICWKDIPDEKISKLGTSLAFLDPKSVRYHLPAFMSYALRTWSKDHSFSAADSILYALGSGPHNKGCYTDSFLLLNHHQNQAVAAFLNFILLVDPIDGDYAAKGLEKGWAEWIPDSLPYSTYHIQY